MIVETLVVGPLGSNVYLVGCPGTRAGMIVDAGDEAERIIAALRGLRLEPRLLINTHGHGDHIGANAELAAAFPEMKLAIHEADAPMLTSATKNLSFFLGERVISPPADRLLAHGQVLELGKWRFTVLHSPGHSPGGICLLHVPPADAGEPPIMFTGDTIFAGSVGRTDFPGCDHAEMLASIRRHILTQDPRCILYPGHGPTSTVGDEARGNPFL